MAAYTLSVAPVPAPLTEAQFRAADIELLLNLGGGPTWSTALPFGSVDGLRLEISDAEGRAYTMRVTRAAIGAPAELTLRLKRHATLDVREDTPLTLRVINLCDASPLLDAPRRSEITPDNERILKQAATGGKRCSLVRLE